MAAGEIETGGSGLNGVPCRYRARAWWGDRMVADSDRAVRVEQPGKEQTLCFPIGDVRLEVFGEGTRTEERPAWGEVRLRSCSPAARPAAGATGTWHDPEALVDGPPGDGTDVLVEYLSPPPDAGWLAGLASFDHDRARVEVLDGLAGDDPRDVTVKRFPTWGEASDLVDILDVRPDGDGAFVGVTRPSPRRPVVEGSQMLGQAIVAAGRWAPGRRTVSAHMVFFRAATTDRPLRFELEEMSGGRTFSTVSASVTQDGRRCAAGTLLLGVLAPDVVRHDAEMPDVPGPYDCPSYDMSVTGRDIRVVDGAYTDDPGAPVGPPVVDAWVRFRDLPDDPYVHAGLLAQFTGHMSIAAALRPHAGVGQRDAHRSISTAINAIAISLHADVRADRWMLYHHESTYAGDGMTHAQCRVHDQGGGLLASFSVDAMVRPFAAERGKVDDRTAL